MSEEKTPFASYHEGYIDGYGGEDKIQASGVYYDQGYEAGREDDLLGNDPKFAAAVSPTPTPVSPNQCSSRVINES
jgi:hypothetical protein